MAFYSGHLGGNKAPILLFSKRFPNGGIQEMGSKVSFVRRKLICHALWEPAHCVTVPTALSFIYLFLIVLFFIYTIASYANAYTTPYSTNL